MLIFLFANLLTMNTDNSIEFNHIPFNEFDYFITTANKTIKTKKNEIKHILYEVLIIKHKTKNIECQFTKPFKGDNCIHKCMFKCLKNMINSNEIKGCNAFHYNQGYIWDLLVELANRT